MPIVTQQIAKDVARELTRKKFKLKIDADIEFRKFVTEKYISSIPDAVVQAHKMHSEYFATTGTIKINASGFNEEQITTHPIDDVTSRYVINNSRNYYAIVELSDEDASVAIKLKRKVQNAEIDYKAAKEAVENALVSLKTYANVEKNFPEAYPLLPVKQRMELAINFEKIRALIK